MSEGRSCEDLRVTDVLANLGDVDSALRRVEHWAHVEIHEGLNLEELHKLTSSAGLNLRAVLEG